MDARRLAIRGVVCNWLGRVCSIVVAFFLTPFLVHTLGNASYGIWALAMTLTNYYALADLGFRSAGTKYIAQFAATGQHRNMGKVIMTLQAVYVVLAGLVLALSALLAVVFPQLFSVSADSITTVRWVVLLTGATVAVRLLAESYGATITALQRHDITSGIAIFAQVAQACALVAVLKADHGLVGMACVTLSVAAVVQVLRTSAALRLAGAGVLRWNNIDRETYRLVYRFGGLTFITHTARQMTENLGSVVVGILLGPAAVPFFAVPESLTRKVRAIGSGVTFVVDPLASHLNAKGNRRALESVLIHAPRFLLAMSLSAAAVFVCLGRRFIELWIDRSYSQTAYPVLCLLAVAMVLRMTANPLRGILRGTARLRPLVGAAGAESLIALTLGPWWVMTSGSVGMAAAIVASQAVASAVMIPVAACRASDFPVTMFLRHAVVRGTIAAVPAWLTAYTLSGWFTPNRLGEIMLLIVLVGVVAAGSIFLFTFDAARRTQIINALLPLKSVRTKQLREAPRR